MDFIMDCFVINLIWLFLYDVVNMRILNVREEIPMELHVYNDDICRILKIFIHGFMSTNAMVLVIQALLGFFVVMGGNFFVLSC